MKQPFILLGPQASGKTFLADKIGITHLIDGSVYCITHYASAKKFEHFKSNSNDRSYSVVIIEEIPDEETIISIHQYLKGLAVGTGIHPLFIFTSNSIDPTTPLRGFHKIICSHHLHVAEFNRKYNVEG